MTTVTTVPFCYRIQATRDLCLALKEHVGRVEEVIAQGGADRSTLMEQNQQRISEYQVRRDT